MKGTQMLLILTLSLLLQDPPAESAPPKPIGEPPKSVEKPKDADLSVETIRGVLRQKGTKVSPGIKRTVHYIYGPGKTDVHVGDIVIIMAMTLPARDAQHHAEMVVEARVTDNKVARELNYVVNVNTEKNQSTHAFFYMVGAPGTTEITFTLSNDFAKVENNSRVFKLIATDPEQKPGPKKAAELRPARKSTECPYI
jgi:hypothetical protein